MEITTLNLSEKQLPIGIFDSGMGGLTVLKALKSVLPQESLMYLGDTARLPYGTKSLKTVQQYALQMASWLIDKKIKMLVIACNTATTAALTFLQHTFPELPIIGVVEPGAKTAIEASKQNTIAVIATETTIRSNIYEIQMQQFNKKVQAFNVACGLFVALAEEGCVDNAIAKSAIAHYLAPIKAQDNIDCLLLGCTHFPVLKTVISEFFEKKLTIIDSAEATAACVKNYLMANNLLADSANNHSQQFFVTDQPERFIRLSPIFFQESVDPKQVELIDAIALDTNIFSKKLYN